MRVSDWHHVPGADLEPLYARETCHWRTTLAWETSSSWTTIETARTTWGLPGLVCRDDAGAICGWSYYMTRDTLDVGGIFAATPAATAALIDALIERAGSPHALRGLLYARGPGLEKLLIERGVPVTRYAYSMRFRSALEHVDPAGITCDEIDVTLCEALKGTTWKLRQWQPEDVIGTSRLLHAAYQDSWHHLVPVNTREAWLQYVSALVVHDGCGRFSPAMSRVLVVNGRLAALAMIATIAPTTAHLVQLAVSPDLHGRGLARALLTAVLHFVDENNFATTSLLVSCHNAAARKLYRNLRFVDRETFLSLASLAKVPKVPGVPKVRMVQGA